MVLVALGDAFAQKFYVTVKPRNTGTCDGKDWRGSVVKLPNHTVTLDKRLAEGGFAIVYLASDKQGHHYALKRQFISDDVRQLEACRRECRIVSCLAGHKNIVSYIDHMILKNNCGVYECSLLTTYYKSSVLQLMNERHLAGRCLSANEILKIFCDVCEAVARLHHSQTPVIHRDLKAENVLIDEHGPGAPVYVLCDFGSATTKVLSSDTQSLQFIEEEIHRYTTLAYRAPEMIDIYSGKPIGTKLDIWALGVMLYRLCYFSLPFGESSLAIQNCSYNFPTEPNYPDELRAIIKVLLDPDLVRRPDIYQVSTLAFEAAGHRCPIGNLNKVPALCLIDAMRNLRQQEVNTTAGAGTSVRTSTFTNFDSRVAQKETATSINPRLRPKPYSNTIRLNLADSSSRLLDVPISKQQNSSSYPEIGIAHTESSQKSCSIAEEYGIETLKSSAFRPYSASSESNTKVSAVEPFETVAVTVSSPVNLPVENDDISSWNPFLIAPFSLQRRSSATLQNTAMDDCSFGHCFDKLPRHLKHFASSKAIEDDADLEIDENDPFAAAPIHRYQMRFALRVVEVFGMKDASAAEKSQSNGSAVQNAILSGVMEGFTDDGVVVAAWNEEVLRKTPSSVILLAVS
uniref:non-specific serine/threonine protein kinase n=1 Tax=Elaeophora elaphi TaxID=1147741 RepID=A0A0R3S2I2_9BILA